jgi:hypothetical protein
MSALLEDKRSTRGLRMGELVGEAAEEDATFWGLSHDIWKDDGSDDESNESYEQEDEKPDLFDSDFNDTETEDDEESDAEKSNKKSDIKEVCLSFFRKTI